MIGAEKTAEMLTTIFWGGNESWRLSSLPLPRGGEGSLHHLFPPPPSFAKASYRIVVTMENAGGGGGAARM